MDELLASLNALTVYPRPADLHNIATQIAGFTSSEITTLISGLTNTQLGIDIALLVTGALPSTLTAPVFVQPVSPLDPTHAAIVRNVDPAMAAGLPPTIKPL